MSKKNVALTLYQVRDEFAKDYIGTLKQIAKIGYPAVQIATVGNITAKELNAVLSDLGLKVAGNHISLDALEHNLDSVIEFNRIIGNKYIICPYLPEERRKDAAGYRNLAKILNEIGGKCKKQGMQLCYHNHSFEFVEFDGIPALDILFRASAPNLVQAEIDVYWVQHGGGSPSGYIRKYAGRCPMVHLKDMENDEKKSFAEVGYGILDWDGIFAACEYANVDWYTVEQDTCKRPPLESAKMSFEFLKKKGIA